MVTLIKKMMMAGLGLEAELRGRLDELAERGKTSDTNCARHVKDFIARIEKEAKPLEAKERELIEKLFSKLKIPSKSDIDRLEQQLRDISSQIQRSARP